MENIDRIDAKVSQAIQDVQKILTTATGTSKEVRIQGKLEITQEAMLAFPGDKER